MKTQFLSCSFLLFCQLAFAQFGTVPQVITSSNLPHTVINPKKFTTCDYNSDGRNDLVVIGDAGATGFRSDGAGSFHAPELLIEQAMMEVPTGFNGAVFTDLDADGLPDLAAGKNWRKNMGNGVLAAQQQVFEKNVALLLDVDGDLLPDALSTDSTHIFWQKNLGLGQFDALQPLLAADHALIFQSADLNHDNLPDFLTRQNNGGYWYKNLGGGSFEAVQLFPGVPENLVTTDLDGDGLTELIYNIGVNIEWQEFDHAGVATPLQTISNKFKTGRGFDVGDLNADGYPDVLVGELTTGQSGSYFKFLPANNQFATNVTQPTPGLFPDYGIAHIDDLDGDGKLDYCTASANNFQMVWFRQISPGVFNFFYYLQAGLHIPKSLVSLDYDNDGDLDLVSTGQEPTNSAFSNSTVVVNLGNGAFDEKRGYPGGGGRNFQGDLDGDGLKDRAFYGNNDSIYWQKFLGNNLWGARKSLPGLITSCKQVAGGDLDQDGDIDLFACNGTDAVSVNARFYWFENDGTGEFTPHLIETDIQLCSSAFPLDVNEDGLLDMVLYFFNSSPRVYTNLGGGIFSAPGNFFPPNNPSPSDVNQSLLTDLDADGRIDYVYITKNWGNQKIGWYRNLGPAGFSSHQTLASWSTNASWATNYFTVFDATGDGLPDIVISDNYWANIRFIQGLGSGTFSAMSVIYSETQPFNYGNFFAITHLDVNNDGKLDIVFGKRSLNNALPNYLMWLSNEFPTPAPGLVLLNKSVSCEDGGTDYDATDDVRVLKMYVNNPANPAGRYFITNPSDTEPLDTFSYGQLAVYRWPPGSAGDGIARMKEVHDLLNPGLFTQVIAESIPHCSAAVPANIAIFEQDWWCSSNSTWTDPSDDMVVLYFRTELQNPQQPSTTFFLSSNLGAVTGLNGMVMQEWMYNQWVIGTLPAGSAGQPGPVVLTLQDKVDTSVVRTISFDNPGVCSVAAAGEAESSSGFQVFPNPVARGQNVNLRLGENFSGETKVEILSLEGRVLRTWHFEKTASRQVENLPTDETLGASFMVRVSDGKRTGIQLVMSL